MEDYQLQWTQKFQSIRMTSSKNMPIVCSGTPHLDFYGINTPTDVIIERLLRI
jgi:hypothetical protein